MSSKHQNIHFNVQHEDPSLLSFLDAKIYHITNLSVVFQESQQLVTFSLITKVSLQSTTKVVFYTQ